MKGPNSHCQRRSLSFILVSSSKGKKGFSSTFTLDKKCLLSKSLQAINAGEGVEKREPSYTVGGNAN